MDAVVHFEIPYENATRIARFYEQAFGWQTQAMGVDMGNYVLATTTPTESGRPTQPGAINGGFYEKKPNWPAQHPSVVMAVADVDTSIRAVASAGGTVLGEPMDIPGVGRYVSFIDTEGNRLSLLQALPRS